MRTSAHLFLDSDTLGSFPRAIELRRSCVRLEVMQPEFCPLVCSGCRVHSLIIYIKRGCGPAWGGSPGWASSHKVKDRQFDSQSGHMPELPIQSPGRGTYESNRLMFLSYIGKITLLFLPPFPSLKKKKKGLVQWSLRSFQV